MHDTNTSTRVLYASARDRGLYENERSPLYEYCAARSVRDEDWNTGKDRIECRPSVGYFEDETAGESRMLNEPEYFGRLGKEAARRIEDSN